MKEALKLALDVLESDYVFEWPAMQRPERVKKKRFEAITAIKEALAPTSTPCEVQPEQEVDWKDQYEKQKRRAEMWLAKYEKVAGPAPCAVPLAQPEQEPGAWIHNFIEGGISIGKRPSDLSRHPDRWTALYRESKPCPTCEALTRTVMLDQTSHDTKRPWVGLTDDERANCWRLSAKQSAINIEAKLKELNT